MHSVAVIAVTFVVMTFINMLSVLVVVFIIVRMTIVMFVILIYSQCAGHHLRHCHDGNWHVCYPVDYIMCLQYAFDLTLAAVVAGWASCLVSSL
jgi:hypothetical protein